MNFYTLRLMESNSLKCSTIQTMHSIELKLGMYMPNYSPTYLIYFGDFRTNSLFCRGKIKFLCITGYGVKI